MAQQIPLDPSARAHEKVQEESVREIAPDIAYLRLLIVNIMFVGPRNAGDREWVLIDAGLPGTMSRITAAAAERFGKYARPAAIVMTHGHFDHVGVLQDLAAQWDAPVYAHPLEHPYLNGKAPYPAPDPFVGGGLMALSGPLFPTSPVDVSARLRALPDDGGVPHMPGWRWLHTPGHSAGHVSFWRESGRALIAGDAVITTAQESAYAATTQAPEMHGPPMYFTPDWQSAKSSAEKLAALEPELLVTGHGRAMQGQQMRDALHRLAREFDSVAVPKHGRYVNNPARAEDGTAYRQA
jgi:glyoxylase-like metal-dependent hydrolase (beta-lactamase superfamily II)